MGTYSTVKQTVFNIKKNIFMQIKILILNYAFEVHYWELQC